MMKHLPQPSCSCFVIPPSARSSGAKTGREWSPSSRKNGCFLLTRKSSLLILCIEVGRIRDGRLFSPPHRSRRGSHREASGSTRCFCPDGARRAPPDPRQKLHLGAVSQASGG